MGKSSQVAMDHDSSGDRITARVGSRTKKAKIVFDPSDHHVPRKRNRRGENEPTTGPGTPKSEPTRTATPLSSSSNEGSSYNNHSSAASALTVGGQRGATATTTSCRACQKCGRSGPGRMPRKSPIAPWTCSGCLIPKTASKARSVGSKQGQPKMQSKSTRDRTPEEEEEEEEADEMNDELEEEEEQEEEEEEDNKQQHDFAGFSETELGGHGKVNDVTVEQKSYVREPHEDIAGARHKSNKPAATSAEVAIRRTNSREEEGDVSAKDVRYWSCDDVCRFFSRHCKSWGDLFHEQEIDGASLLLMRKCDVLSRFGLKLGPAMELYQRIVALQNGDRETVDVRLTWI